MACGVPLEHVRETMRPLPVEPLAGVPAFVLGVSLIRGRPTPVVDGLRLLGGRSASRATRYVALELGARGAALAVDEVLGVRDVSPETFGVLPGILGGAQEHVAALGSLDTELLLVLEHGRLLPDAAWARLDERQGAAP